MKNNILLSLLIPMLISCQIKDPIPQPDPDDNNGPFEILWQVPLNEDTSECFSMAPAVFNNKVVYSMLFYMDGYELFRGVNAQTGASLWHWMPPYPGEVTSRLTRSRYENILAISHIDNYYGLDMNTGQPNWISRVGNDEITGSHAIRIINDQVYSTHSNKIIDDTVSFLVRASLTTGSWDTVFQTTKKNGYRPTLYPPALWVSPTGDSILVFQNRQWNFALSDDRVDLIAYNLTTRQIKWEVNDFDPAGNSSIYNMLIHNDQVYFCGEKTLHCFDAATGAKRWSWTTPVPTDNLLLTNLVIAEGRLFVKPTNERNLYSLNPNTGEINTTYPCGAGGVLMTHHDGILYLCPDASNKMYALRIADGKWLWEHESPNNKKPGKAYGRTLFDDPTVSPEHNCVFVADRFFLMAIKLPK